MTTPKPMDLISEAQRVGTEIRDAVRDGHAFLRDLREARRQVTEVLADLKESRTVVDEKIAIWTKEADRTSDAAKVLNAYKEELGARLDCMMTVLSVVRDHDDQFKTALDSALKKNLSSVDTILRAVNEDVISQEDVLRRLQL